MKGISGPQTKHVYVNMQRFRDCLREPCYGRLLKIRQQLWPSETGGTNQMVNKYNKGIVVGANNNIVRRFDKSLLLGNHYDFVFICNTFFLN